MGRRNPSKILEVLETLVGLIIRRNGVEILLLAELFSGYPNENILLLTIPLRSQREVSVCLSFLFVPRSQSRRLYGQSHRLRSNVFNICPVDRWARLLS